MFIDTVRFARPIAGIFTATVALVACPVYAQITTIIPAANRITASDGKAEDFFGRDLAVSENALLVGAIHNSVNGNSNQGAAYLFNATTGAQQLKLTASDGAAENYFGGSVALSGNTALVGAQYNYVNGNRYQGAAYLFDATTGVQQFKLTASDGAALSDFGSSVALSGNTALIGAVTADVNGNNNQGAAYLFSTLTGAQQLKLTASDGTAGDYFGSSVALSGSTALIGAFGAGVNGNLNQGAAYLFDATTGAQLARLVASDGTADENFGTSVALFGNTALVGASSKTVNGKNAQGAVYAFDITTGLQIGKFITADGATNDRFGVSVALNGTNAFAGAYFDDAYQGSAYRFTVPNTATAAAPEPGSIALLLTAGVPVVGILRRRKK